MESKNLDLSQSFPKGCRTLLFIERKYFVLADAEFTKSDIEINYLQRHDFQNPITAENYAGGLAEIIERIKSLKTLSPRIAVSLPSFLFDISIYTLPKTKNAYIDLFVRDKLNCTDRKLYYKYSVLGETGDKDSTMLSVLACSTPASVVNDFYYQFEKAGMRAQSMSHPTIGLTQLLKARSRDISEELLILVDTVARPISISVYNDGKLSQIRMLQSLDCGNYERFVHNITVELKRTIHYCRQTYFGRIADRILYLGDKSNEFADVIDDIHRNVDHPIMEIQFENIRYPTEAVRDESLEKYLPSLCGLHLMSSNLTGFLGKQNKFNFISSQSKSKALVSLLIALLLIVSAIVINLDSKIEQIISDYEADLVQLETKRSQYQDIDVIASGVEALDRCYGNYRDIMGDMNGPQENLSWLVLAIIDCVPESSHIVSLNLRESAMNSEERVFYCVIRDDFSHNSSLGLEDCIARLRNTGFFTSVDYSLLGSSSKNQSDENLEDVRLEIRL